MYKAFDNYTPYIKVPPSTQIVFNIGAQNRYIYLYDGNFVQKSSYGSYSGERTITTTSVTRAVRLRFNGSSISNVYVKNKTTGEYYFNGAEYTD